MQKFKYGPHLHVGKQVHGRALLEHSGQLAEALRRQAHDDISVTESVAVLAVTPATFWPGVQVNGIGKLAGSNVSVVTAVGVPSPMRMLQAAVATRRTRYVWGPNAVDAALVVVRATF
ncbi:hypothetical protein [Bradyrhizobium sp. JR18.2]|uniref:hypothetical protein n=1 Tax=Bradyrhizobium sp. JR18.2 TaxID=3156369 RepID=UPI0033987F13